MFMGQTRREAPLNDRSGKTEDVRVMGMLNRYEKTMVYIHSKLQEI